MKKFDHAHTLGRIEVSQEEMMLRCTQMQEFANRLYEAANVSRSDLLASLNISPHTMFDRKRRDLRLSTLNLMYKAGFEACGMEPDLEALLEALARCCREGKELVIRTRNPDEADSPTDGADEVCILRRSPRTRRD